MKRLLTHTFIAAYLSALSWGILSHTVSFGTTSHPGMYYVVWDMFCGWSSYSSRNVIIAQGESGKYYELAPGPWGEFQPFGSIGRRHYDVNGGHAPKLALNALRQTKHERITRIIVIEEVWAKQYNLPDKLWNRQFDEPKDIHKYYQVRHVFTPDGGIVRSYPSWLGLQYTLAVSDNPRLKAEQRSGKPFFVYRPQRGGRRVGSTLGNGN